MHFSSRYFGSIAHALCFTSTFFALIALPVHAAPSTLGDPPVVTLNKSGPDAPTVSVYRDDRVATLDLDFIAGNPWTPFDIGEDGLGPVGYRVAWKRVGSGAWKSENGKAARYNHKVTSLRRTQIQPLLNDVPYKVRVDFINRFGKVVGDYAYGIIQGGCDDRVETLRNEMTGFFDDFNQSAGLPDERRWNTTFSKANDPGFQAFFVNSQFHSHTLVGTPAFGYGDRGQTVHRVRNPLQLGPGDTRRIVFDLDGVSIGGRTVWYLDLLSEQTDITSHYSIGGGPGDFGHPSPGLRFKLVGQEVSVWTLNSRGEQILIERNSDIDWGGVQTVPNVRRQMEIQVSEEHVAMYMDDHLVLDTDLGSNALNPGDYTVHWTAFGYNTMKVNLPYMLLHWDNFGFDGPPSTEVVHNYRTQIAGSDYIQSNSFLPERASIKIPDSMKSPTPGVMGEATLYFTRQMSTHSPADWDADDRVRVGDLEFAIPAPESTANPPLPISTLINSNSGYSTSIPLGTVGDDGTAPLESGENKIFFAASQCGFHNIHIEIKWPKASEPVYTPPQKIHTAPMHHHFPRLGLPARITRIAGHEVFSWQEHMDDPANFNPIVNGVIEVGSIVNGDEFTSDETLNSDFVSPQLAGNGENPGVSRVELWLRPDDGSDQQAILIDSVDTINDVAAPQYIGKFTLDTSEMSNGVYELFLLAIDSNGIESTPGFYGIGQAAGSLEAMNGFYYPIHITVDN